MQRRSEETRKHIVEAAQELFAKEGYESTSVADICRSADVSKGAFYHHFPTKQTVFLRLLEDWLADIDAELEAARGERGDVPQSLIHMASKTQDLLSVADGRLPMFLEFWSQARLEPTVWQATVAPYRRYRQFFKELIEEGIAEGTIGHVDSGVAAKLIVSLAVGLLLQCVLDPHGEDWGRVVGQSVELLLEGLARREN